MVMDNLCNGSVTIDSPSSSQDIEDNNNNQNIQNQNQNNMNSSSNGGGLSTLSDEDLTKKAQEELNMEEEMKEVRTGTSSESKAP